MEAKTLRIGNIIMGKVNGISKVEQIGSSINPEYVGGRTLEGDYWENSYLPIVITESWLLDLGFNKDYIPGYIGINTGDVDFVLAYPNFIGSFQTYFAFQFHSCGWSKFIEIKNVHELQNLFFAITGQDLQLAIDRVHTR